MVYDGRAVANFVLDYCDGHGRKVTNLALQKIVYFCHVWSLIELDKPLVKHSFEAWQHGPVLQYLYHEFKTCDAEPISFRARKINTQNGKREVVTYAFEPEVQSFLEGIVEFYSRMDGIYLRNLSHVKGGPWDKVWHHDEAINPGMRIEDGEIKKFYSQKQKPYAVQ